MPLAWSPGMGSFWICWLYSLYGRILMSLKRSDFWVNFYMFGRSTQSKKLLLPWNNNYYIIIIIKFCLVQDDYTSLSKRGNHNFLGKTSHAYPSPKKRKQSFFSQGASNKLIISIHGFGFNVNLNYWNLKACVMLYYFIVSTVAVATA